MIGAEGGVVVFDRDTDRVTERIPLPTSRDMPLTRGASDVTLVPT